MAGGNNFDSTRAALGQQLLSTPTTVSLSGSSAASTQLAVGRYRVVSTVDCFLKQGATGLSATTSGHFLPQNVIDYVTVDDTTNNGYIAGITSGGTGTLFLSAQ